MDPPEPRCMRVFIPYLSLLFILRRTLYYSVEAVGTQIMKMRKHVEGSIKKWHFRAQKSVERKIYSCVDLRVMK